jgi:hypothetical protein
LGFKIHRLATLVPFICEISPTFGCRLVLKNRSNYANEAPAEIFVSLSTAVLNTKKNLRKKGKGKFRVKIEPRKFVRTIRLATIFLFENSFFSKAGGLHKSLFEP